MTLRSASPSAASFSRGKGYPGSQAKAVLAQAKAAAESLPSLPPLPPKRPTPPGGPSPGGPARDGSRGRNPYQQAAVSVARKVRRSSSLSAMPKMPTGAKLSPLPPEQRSRGTESAAARTQAMATSDPSPMAPASAAVLDLARGAEEVLRIGEWSVRKLPQNIEDISLVYLNEEEGRVEVNPPRELVDALENEDEGDALAAEEVNDSEGKEPLFQRILLGKNTEAPLRMARDILEAIREDISIFNEVQERFSEAPDEPIIGLGDGLGEELEDVILALKPGELSDVLATEAGMQILLRIQ
eukprot:TRINITY_DN83411_c0_g1_i1.p1 TRINITY_DN83411_c0_g1~~TRINITY_DN83411_c0_g1_i1.p1  ORF type:complete len:312 (-),score=73.10 TRINITY_DN83411_c0_g1_i1:25-921(-)